MAVRKLQLEIHHCISKESRNSIGSKPVIFVNKINKSSIVSLFSVSKMTRSKDLKGLHLRNEVVDKIKETSK